MIRLTRCVAKTKTRGGRCINNAAVAHPGGLNLCTRHDQVLRQRRELALHDGKTAKNRVGMGSFVEIDGITPQVTR